MADELTTEELQALNALIDELISEGWSRFHAEEAASIMLGLSEGDVIKE